MLDTFIASTELTARLKHPCFPQPSTQNLKVWRYLNLAKLVHLLNEERLYMSRLDRLSDPYEGSLTAKTIEGVDLFLKQHGAEGGWNEVSESYRKNQQTTYVCCWHANEQESEAMWRLYCENGHGVSIQTTYRNLVQAIEGEDNVYVGCVKYIDYEKEWFPDANTFYPVMHKRIAFSHEQEIRLVTSLANYHNTPLDQVPESQDIPWKSTELIERIHVDPYAPEYFFEAVRTIVREIAPSLSEKVVWSQMRAAPFF